MEKNYTQAVQVMMDHQESALIETSEIHLKRR